MFSVDVEATAQAGKRNGEREEDEHHMGGAGCTALKRVEAGGRTRTNLDQVPERADCRQTECGETERLVPLVKRKLQRRIDGRSPHDEAEAE